jgi:hypothetical protein
MAKITYQDSEAQVPARARMRVRLDELPITSRGKQLILIVDVALNVVFSRGTSFGAVAGLPSLVACRRCGSFGWIVC